MDASQKRVRPGFLLSVVVIFGFLCWWVSLGVPSEKDKTRSKVILTRVEERVIVELLEERAVKTGGLTNLENEFVLNSLRSTNKHQLPVATRTNASGRVTDIWQSAFEIKRVGPTNFVVRSAGPNLVFGDTDDIIHSSASNHVEP